MDAVYYPSTVYGAIDTGASFIMLSTDVQMQHVVCSAWHFWPLTWSLHETSRVRVGSCHRNDDYGIGCKRS